MAKTSSEQDATYTERCDEDLFKRYQSSQWNL